MLDGGVGSIDVNVLRPFGRIPSLTLLDGNVSTYLHGDVKGGDVILQRGLE